MLRFLIALFVISVAVQTCHAQILRSFGLKAAYTSANQSINSSSEGLDRRPGVCAALFAEWLNDPCVSVVSQVEYVQRGTRFTVHPTIPELFWMHWNVDIRIDYLSMPLFFKVRLPLTVLTPYIFGGPRLDVLLSHRSTDLDIDYLDPKKSSFGASVGIGVEIAHLLPGQLLVEGRYNADLTAAYPSEYPYRNNAFDIWIGFGF